MDTAPQIRVRRAHDRARDQLADLAVLNERLAFGDEEEATLARRRLDYLKRRRKTWELVYQHVVREDALCTLSAIEDANSRVEKALSEQSRERIGVGALKRQLLDLQKEVSAAHSRLHTTQERVDVNLRRISELKEEAARMDMNARGSGSGTVNAARTRRRAAPVTAKSNTKNVDAMREDDRYLGNLNGECGGLDARQRGLESTLDLEDGLKNQ